MKKCRRDATRKDTQEKHSTHDRPEEVHHGILCPTLTRGSSGFWSGGASERPLERRGEDRTERGDEEKIVSANR